jgi:hypothetical protein
MSGKIIQLDLFIEQEAQRIAYERDEAEKNEKKFQAEAKSCIRGLFARHSETRKEVDDLKVIIFNLYQDVKHLKEYARG